MGSLNIIRRFRDLLDVTFGTPNDGDVVTYDAGTDKLILSAGGGGAPAGPAGGALDGTYPNPGLAASVAGSGLSEAADVLAVNVDGSTIEVAADALQVKDGGITVAKLSFDPATQAELDAHLNDVTDAHDASAISSVPAGSLAATDVQAALNELDTEKAAAASAVMDGDAAGGVLSGTYPNPGFAADMATQAELDAHVNDASDAHDASAISVADAGTFYAATDVEGVLQEIGPQLGAGGPPSGAAGGALDGNYPNPGLAAGVAGAGLAEAADVLSVNVDNSTIEINADTLRVKDGGITAAKVAADVATQAELDAHVNDISAAHAASAISVDSTTLSGVGTDVQASLEEIDNLLDDHSARHENGGADEISVAGLSGKLADAQPVTVRKNTGANVGTRARLNFIEGTNVTVTVADDGVDDEIDVTIAASGGGGSGSAMSISVAQTGHGFAVGDVVRLSGADTYAKAQADTEAHAEVAGIVSAVADADHFTLTTGGDVTGLSGLSAGSVYYLSPSSAGALTATEPSTTGQISKPVLIARTTTAGEFFNMRGIVITASTPVTGEEESITLAQELFA